MNRSSTQPLNGTSAVEEPRITKAAVLAGGRGTRLAPYTSVLPKPLMPVGDRAILEIVVDQLVDHGFTDITLCVGYLSHLIRAVMDASEQQAACIRFHQESAPLGTAGPLRLIGDLNETFVAMNGDVLTTLDFRQLVREHRRSGNVVTIASYERAVKIDYGVLQMNRADSRVRPVRGYIEKPEIPSIVSMGIYVLEPRALDFIPEGRPFDFPDLVHALLAADEPVGAYVHDGLWFDIGRQDDYFEAARVWLESQPVRASRSPNGGEPLGVNGNGVDGARRNGSGNAALVAG